MYANTPTPNIPLLRLPSSESPPPLERSKPVHIFLLLATRSNTSSPSTQNTTVEGVYQDIEDAHNALRKYANSVKKNLGKDLQSWKPSENVFSGRVSCEVMGKAGERVQLEVRRKEVIGKGGVEKCVFE